MVAVNLTANYREPYAAPHGSWNQPGLLTGYFDGSYYHIFYIATDGQVHSFWVDAGHVYAGPWSHGTVSQPSINFSFTGVNP
jgi:hypothetical protein